MGLGAVTLANLWLNHFTAATSVNSLALANYNNQDQLIYQVSGTGTGQQSAVTWNRQLFRRRRCGVSGCSECGR